MSKGYQKSLKDTPFGLEDGFRRFRIPVRNKVVNVAAAGAGVGFGTVVLSGLPQGYYLYAGGVAQLGFSTADTDVVVAFDRRF
jgi:hypothetical protein